MPHCLPRGGCDSCSVASTAQWRGPLMRAGWGQHGLETVMAVAQGFEVQREPIGKRITARIGLPDDPGGDITGRRPQ